MEEYKNTFRENGRIIAWGVIAVLVSGALFLLAEFAGSVKMLPYIGQGTDFTSTIVVQGEGEVTVPPDTAMFSFAVVREAETASEAQNRVAETMNGLIEYLDEFGVKEENVKTLNYNISPRYEYREASEISPPSGRRVLVGYEASHFVSVKLPELDSAGEVLGGLGSRGADNVSNFRLTVEDEDAARRKARAEAIKDAQEKARVLADDLGVRLVKIVSFNENGGPVYRFAGGEALESRAAHDASVPQIPTGENTITANVSITYAID